MLNVCLCLTLARAGRLEADSFDMHSLCGCLKHPDCARAKSGANRNG